MEIDPQECVSPFTRVPNAPESSVASMDSDDRISKRVKLSGKKRQSRSPEICDSDEDDMYKRALAYHSLCAKQERAANITFVSSTLKAPPIKKRRGRRPLHVEKRITLLQNTNLFNPPSVFAMSEQKHEFLDTSAALFSTHTYSKPNILAPSFRQVNTDGNEEDGENHDAIQMYQLKRSEGLIVSSKRQLFNMETNVKESTAVNVSSLFPSYYWSPGEVNLVAALYEVHGADWCALSRALYSQRTPEDIKILVVNCGLDADKVLSCEFSYQGDALCLYDELWCDVCGEFQESESMILCDTCDKGFHLFCLTPSLSSVPKGKWYCGPCTESFFDPSSVTNADISTADDKSVSIHLNHDTSVVGSSSSTSSPSSKVVVNENENICNSSNTPRGTTPDKPTSSSTLPPPLPSSNNVCTPTSNTGCNRTAFHSLSEPIIDEDGDVLFKVRVKGHRETVEACLPSQYWNNIYEKDKISPAALMNSMQYVKKDALRSIQSKGEKMLQSSFKQFSPSDIGTSGCSLFDSRCWPLPDEFLAHTPLLRLDNNGYSLWKYFRTVHGTNAVIPGSLSTCTDHGYTFIFLENVRDLHSSFVLNSVKKEVSEKNQKGKIDNNGGIGGWVYTFPPEKYDIDASLAMFPTSLHVMVHRAGHSITLNAPVYIWRSGSKPGIIAMGYVKSLPLMETLSENFLQFVKGPEEVKSASRAHGRVFLEITNVFSAPLNKKTCHSDPCLRGMAVMRPSSSTNMLKLASFEKTALDAALMQLGNSVTILEPLVNMTATETSNETVELVDAPLTLGEYCEVCKGVDNDHLTIICDSCGSGYHTYCLSPPLSSIPDQDHWMCHVCFPEPFTPTEMKGLYYFLLYKELKLESKRLLRAYAAKIEDISRTNISIAARLLTSGDPTCEIKHKLNSSMKNISLNLLRTRDMILKVMNQELYLLYEELLKQGDGR